MPNPRWTVYILLCADTSLYTGISNHPQKRFLAHKRGHGGAYTRSHPPLRIVYIEAGFTKSAALKREAEIKSWTRQKKISALKLKIKLQNPKSL